MKKIKNFLGIDEWMDLLGSNLGQILGIIIGRGFRLSVIASAIRIWRKFDLKFFQYMLLFFITCVAEILSMFISLGITFLICFIYEIIKKSVVWLYVLIKDLIKKEKTLFQKKGKTNVSKQLTNVDTVKELSFKEIEDEDPNYRLWECEIENGIIRILKNKMHPFYSVYAKRYVMENKIVQGYMEISSKRAINLLQAKKVANIMYNIVLQYEVPGSE